MKRLQKYKKIIAFLLVGVIITFNASASYVHASGVVSGATAALEASANALVKLFLVGNGVISRSGIGALSGASSSLQASLLDEVQNQIGLGNIYEQDDIIYFNAEAMTGLYARLGRSSNSRIVSDFSTFNLYAPDNYSGYVSPQYLDNVNTIVNNCKTSGKRYLLGQRVNDYISDGKHYVELAFFGQILPDDFGFCVIDQSSTDYYYYKKTGTDLGYNAYTYQTSVMWRNSVVYNHVSPFGASGKKLTYYPFNASYSLPFYNYFPSYAYNPTGGSWSNWSQYLNFYCSDPFIIAQSGVDANVILNQSSGNYFFNNYPTYQISSNTFYNNDWTSIYNSYTTNVSNTYNTEIENNQNLTTQDIYDIMDTYIQSIYIGIEDGDTDIANKVDYINEWLSKIYENTNTMIYSLDELITAVTSGGSGCLWTQSEIDSVLDNLSGIYNEQVSTDSDVLAALQYLKDRLLAVQNTTDVVNSTLTNINTNSGIIVDSLDMELSRLATIMTKLDTIIDKLGGLNGIDLPSIDPSLSVDLDDILDDDFLDQVFNPFLLASQIISVVVPFCYLFVAVGILNFLKAEPEVPKWKIPIKIDRFNIDTEFEIDLTPYANLAVFIRAFVFMAFGFGLAIGSINIVKRVLNILA